MPIKIDLVVADTPAIQAFKAVAELMREASKAQNSLNASFRKAIPLVDRLANSYAKLAANASAAADQMNRVSGQTVPTSGRGGGLGSGRAVSQRAPKAPPIVDPAQAMSYYGGQIRGGNASAANVAGYNRAVRASRAKDPQNQLTNAVMRSRFFQVGNKLVGQPLGIDIKALMQSGQGGALSQILNGGIPLGGLGGGAVRGAAGAAGGAGGGGIGALGAAAGALAAPLAAAAVAAGMVAAAFSEAAGLMKSAGLRAEIGGSGREFSAASRVGAYFGNQGLAGQVASNIQGGYGAGYAASIGVNPNGGPFGDMNSSRKFTQIARDIGNSKTYEEARRKAAMVGAPELANLQQLKGSTRDALLGGGFGNSEESYKAALELNAQMAILGQSFDTLRVQFLLPTIQGLNAAAAAFNQLDKFTHGFVSTVAKALGTSGIGGLVDAWNKITGGGSAKSAESATDRNTRAVNENTRALKDKEIVGGGPRASGAIPRGINGINGISGDARPGLGLI